MTLTKNVKLGMLPNIFYNNNFLINGAFDIWQRGEPILNASNGDYLADRWKTGKAGSQVWSYQKGSSKGIANISGGPATSSSFRLDVSTAEASLTGNEVNNIQQVIEGIYFRHLIGKTVTLSFWAYSSDMTGTFSVWFRNGANTDIVYCTERTLTATGIYQFFEITLGIPDIGDSVWGTHRIGNGPGMGLGFTTSCGPDRTTTSGNLNKWRDTSGETLSTQAGPNQTNFASTTGNNRLHFAQIKLEIGNKATPFYSRPLDQELRLCQRYFYSTYPMTSESYVLDAPGSSGANYYDRAPLGYRGEDDNNRTGQFLEGDQQFFPVAMRTKPTLTPYAPTTGAAGKCVHHASTLRDFGFTDAYNTNLSIWRANNTTALDVGDIMSFHLTADAEL